MSMAVFYLAMKTRPLVIALSAALILVAGGVWWLQVEAPPEEAQGEEADETGMTADEREELMRTIGYVQQ